MLLFKFIQENLFNNRISAFTGQYDIQYTNTYDVNYYNYNTLY